MNLNAPSTSARLIKYCLIAIAIASSPPRALASRSVETAATTSSAQCGPVRGQPKSDDFYDLAQWVNAYNVALDEGGQGQSQLRMVQSELRSLCDKRLISEYPLDQAALSKKLSKLRGTQVAGSSAFHTAVAACVIVIGMLNSSCADGRSREDAAHEDWQRPALQIPAAGAQ